MLTQCSKTDLQLSGVDPSYNSELLMPNQQFCDSAYSAICAAPAGSWASFDKASSNPHHGMPINIYTY